MYPFPYPHTVTLTHMSTAHQFQAKLQLLIKCKDSTLEFTKSPLTRHTDAEREALTVEAGVGQRPPGPQTSGAWRSSATARQRWRAENGARRLALEWRTGTPDGGTTLEDGEAGAALAGVGRRRLGTHAYAPRRRCARTSSTKMPGAYFVGRWASS